MLEFCACEELLYEQAICSTSHFSDPNVHKNAGFKALRTSHARVRELLSETYLLYKSFKTSPALTPYYSYRSQELCSTSHLSIVLEARRRQHMRQHDENEKNESKNSSEW